MQRLPELDGAGKRQHGGLLRLARLVEQACGLERRRCLVGEGHDGRQVSLTQSRADDHDGADRLVANHQGGGDHGAHVEQLAYAAGVGGDDWNGDGHPPDQLVGVSDVVRPERGADTVEDRSPVEGNDRADG